MKHLNPIIKFKLTGVRMDEKGILRLSERFLVENHESLQDCTKSVRKRLKKAKSDGYHGTIHSIRQSGVEEFIDRY